MNAYELADAIKYCGDGGYNQDAATMLRQQANRIAELEKEKKTEPFIWLKQDFDGEWIEVFPNKGIPLYTHPNKELSDEEIETIMYKCDWSYDPVSFARAIIKASMGEE